ncbi:MAG TPA: enoyl-CoA hydratase-related protein [bacterium]|nr:enoyl-CoA hydratase-related protein [bacterium]
MSSASLKFFRMETDRRGITVVTFDRPPVNAISFDVYPEIRQLSEAIEATDETRVVVLTAPPGARAWCGGADVRDFLPLDYKTRMERYALINECMPRFYNLNRPVIAAINSHAVGVGLVLAGFCDIRVAASDAFFACPEIDRGVLAGGGAFLSRIGVPPGRIREMMYTGKRFTAEDLRDTGMFNYVVPKDQVMPKALEIAEVIAQKSLPALKANKICTNATESMSWTDAYKTTQEHSARLTITKDAKEGIRAFLEKRKPVYVDR